MATKIAAKIRAEAVSCVAFVLLGAAQNERLVPKLSVRQLGPTDLRVFMRVSVGLVLLLVLWFNVGG